MRCLPWDRGGNADESYFMLPFEILTPKSGPYFRGANCWFNDNLLYGGILTPPIYRSNHELSRHVERLDHILKDVAPILPKVYQLLHEAEFKRAYDNAIVEEDGRMEVDWDPVIESDIEPQPQHFEGLCAHYHLMPTRMLEVTADPNVAKIFSLNTFKSEDSITPYAQRYLVKPWRDETTSERVRYGWFPASWEDSYIKDVFNRGGKENLSPEELIHLSKRSSFVFELNVPDSDVKLVYNYARQKLMLGAVRPMRQTAFGIFIKKPDIEEYLPDSSKTKRGLLTSWRSSVPIKIAGIYAYHPALYPLAPHPFRSWKDLPASCVFCADGKHSWRSGTTKGVIETPWGLSHVPPDYLVEGFATDMTLHHIHDDLILPLYMGKPDQRKKAEDFFLCNSSWLFPINEHECFKGILQRLKNDISIKYR